MTNDDRLTDISTGYGQVFDSGVIVTDIDRIILAVID